MSLSSILAAADLAGEKAFNTVVPTPMNVIGGGKVYHVPDGACGFAWVTIYSIDGKKVRAGTKIAKELEAFGFRKSYTGGFQKWDHHMTQSVARKEAYMDAYASVLRRHGIQAYADSRLD